MTDSIKFRDDGGVEALIPKALYLTIVKVQAASGCDWSAACLQAAILADSGGAKFKERIEEEVTRRLNSELLTRLNKGRSTIRTEAYNSARVQYEIWYYCAENGERINFVPNSDSHMAAIGYMREGGWGHHPCLEGKQRRLEELDRDFEEFTSED